MDPCPQEIFRHVTLRADPQRDQIIAPKGGVDPKPTPRAQPMLHSVPQEAEQARHGQGTAAVIQPAVVGLSAELEVDQHAQQEKTIPTTIRGSIDGLCSEDRTPQSSLSQLYCRIQDCFHVSPHPNTCSPSSAKLRAALKPGLG